MGQSGSSEIAQQLERERAAAREQEARDCEARELELFQLQKFAHAVSLPSRQTIELRLSPNFYTDTEKLLLARLGVPEFVHLCVRGVRFEAPVDCLHEATRAITSSSYPGIVPSIERKVPEFIEVALYQPAGSVDHKLFEALSIELVSVRIAREWVTMPVCELGRVRARDAPPPDPSLSIKIPFRAPQIWDFLPEEPSPGLKLLAQLYDVEYRDTITKRGNLVWFAHGAGFDPITAWNRFEDCTRRAHLPTYRRSKGSRESKASSEVSIGADTSLIARTIYDDDEEA